MTSGSGHGSSSRRLVVYHAFAMAVLALLCAGIYANTLASPFLYEVRWPNGEEQLLKGLVANRSYTLSQVASQAVSQDISLGALPESGDES